MTAHRIASADSCGASRPSRRRAFVVGAILVAALLAVAAGVFVNLGRWVAAGGAAPVRGDVIVVLGGDEGYRVSKVAQLFAAGHAPTVLVTGLEFSPDRERGYYLNWRVQVLADAGVPPERLLVEKTATNSFQEAAATLALMRARGWQTALVVSDPPHMRRLDWVWGRAFAGSGKTYVLVASEPAWWDAEHWWRNEKAGQFVLTEVIKIGYYLAKY